MQAALAERYPKAFGAPRPLAIGVCERIIADWSSVDRRALSDALRKWCGRAEYRASFASATHRTGLDGSPAGVITDGEREHAKLQTPGDEK
jgi:sRNA-binding protein